MSYQTSNSPGTLLACVFKYLAILVNGKISKDTTVVEHVAELRFFVLASRLFCTSPERLSNCSFLHVPILIGELWLIDAGF